ncbi:RNA pseudouridine synthase [Frateuria aurantia]
MTEPVRLSRRVVALTQCSRREAEQYIEGGWVRVDGVVEERPQFMVGDQRVSIDPKARLTAIEPVTMVWHQPNPSPRQGSPAELAEQLSAARHWSDDHSGIRPLRRHLQRLSTPLALPAEAHGLVVFSQDPRVLRKLEDTQQPVEQEFIVDIRGELSEQGLALLNHGLRIHQYALPPIKVSRQSEQRLRFAFKRLQAERIALMCAAVGVEATSIRRLRIGRQSLSRLPAGQWRYLAPYERF